MNSVKRAMLNYSCPVANAQNSSSEANALSFCGLPKDLHICVASNFSFLELTRLASTCRKFSKILKNNQEHISPYIKTILREVKILKYGDVFKCHHVSNISEITFFFKICLKLSILQIDNIDVFTRGASLNEIIKLHPNCKIEICGMEIDIIKGQNYDNKYLKTLIQHKKYNFDNIYYLNLVDFGLSDNDIQWLNAMDN